jgi:hypothetical protein
LARPRFTAIFTRGKYGFLAGPAIFFCVPNFCHHSEI